MYTKLGNFNLCGIYLEYPTVILANYIQHIQCY